ncbi:NifB/NifX family molybdenum-iron cluster-binding protein [Helicobacter sp.]|uniref:NifB/NifX family molybdenum-iron cluster-binding protein n=1 Tax=Helicobacter sp. TaxID=218 RepID=UPI0025BFCACE|nr:hypothetical protein [Helicobacter sp.]MCI5969460.1 hypothetical protein [Helicobacter sp.]MDY2584219.1 hypothetical protein [Helicobacter sp.]
MKIAIPVFDESLKVFNNTGHTPFFAIFEQSGNGMFKKIDYIELRKNPRGDENANRGCAHKDEQMSEEEQIAHKNEHNVLGEIIHDCAVVLVKKACQNTAKVFNERGIKVCKMDRNCQSAKDALKYIKF